MRGRNKRKYLFIGILLMAIGVAAVTTTLVLNGTLNILGDTVSFDGDVVFVSAKTESEGTATISEDGKSITFISRELSKVNESTTLDFEIANKNRQYDAIASINCNTSVSEYADYIKITPNKTEYEIVAGGTDTGKLSAMLVKSYDKEEVAEVEFTCNLVATAKERETIGEEYKDKTIINVLASKAVLDNKIDFSKKSNDTNGKGLYLLESTKDDEYPIYYYRGEVDNNNILFGNFCWKIVRTTSTGGTKLIYNGSPDEDGKCMNTTGTSTQITTKAGSTTSSFNPTNTSPAYNGYMYGKVYEYKSKSTSSIGKIKYGNSFDYNKETKMYTLKDTIDVENDPSGKIDNNHYTCFNETGECNTISYIYYMYTSTAYYIEIEDGKGVEQALEEMQENEHDSKIKEEIDYWYENNMVDYTEYLEDTIWCNDRSMSAEYNNGWKANGGSTSEYLYYGAGGRRDKTYEPIVTCPNKNDAFTVNNEEGNKMLDYPVGLLTADEIMLAGGQTTNNSTYYLYTNRYWWSLSPFSFYNYNANGIRVNSMGGLNVDYVINMYGVRPSVSLQPGTKIVSGDGTQINPYVVET